jgi:hypothetical protein
MTTQSNKALDICRFLCYNTGMKNEKSSNNLTVKVYSGSDGSLEKGTSRLTLSQNGVVVAPFRKECHATNFFNYSQGENNMAYSPKQEQALQNAAPITNESAEVLASELGVSKRSVISKAVMLKIYQKAAPRSKAAAKPRKVDVVAEIARALSAEDLSGLEGATMRSLYALLKSIG